MSEVHRVTVYYVEWNKNKAQEMLTNKKYFGEDTIQYHKSR